MTPAGPKEPSLSSTNRENSQSRSSGRRMRTSAISSWRAVQLEIALVEARVVGHQSQIGEGPLGVAAGWASRRILAIFQSCRDGGWLGKSTSLPVGRGMVIGEILLR